MVGNVSKQKSFRENRKREGRFEKEKETKRKIAIYLAILDTWGRV